MASTHPVALAPLSYRANMHAKETKGHGKGNTLRFNALTDAAATTFVPTITALMSVVNTSITARIAQHNEGKAHPAGTRLSCKVLVRDSGIRVARFNLRNLAPLITSAQVESIFTGGDGSGPDSVTVVGCVALSAAPQFVLSGALITSASAAITRKV